MIFGKSSILSRRKQIGQHRFEPRLESLEDRRLLATLTVDTAEDIVDGDVSSIAALLDTSGDDGFISLREAIQATNATAGADTITFDDSLAVEPINLNLGELVITDELSVTGLGASQTIVDAGGQSRIFNITAASGDFLFEGLTVTGGLAVESRQDLYGGGAIHSASLDMLTISRSTISGNSTVPANNDRSSPGGGISARGNVNLVDSTITGNSTTGRTARGGGIYSYGNVSGDGSTVTGNTTTGYSANGGGIFARGNINLVDSTISGNSTAGSDAVGGGLSADGNINLVDSKVSENSSAWGGGINSEGTVHVERSSITNNVGGGVFGFSVILNNSTVSGNSPGRSAGGGIRSGGTVSLVNSTVSGNTQGFSGNEQGGAGRGGGINAEEINLISSTVSGNLAGSGGGISGNRITIVSSIVAGNAISGESSQGSDIYEFHTRRQALTTSDRSLIGDNQGTSLAEAQTPDANGNLIGSSAGAGVIDALLTPLSDYGGLTKTHALLPDSPAIDAGRNPQMLEFDQRGEPFERVLGGRVDIGAFEGTAEVQPVTLIVTTSDDELDTQFDPDDLSLREAIDLANSNPGSDEIIFDSSLAGSTILLNLGQFIIHEELSITGLGPNQTTIDAQAGSRIFNITTNSGNFLFQGMTLTGGQANSRGGAVRSASIGRLTIRDSIISGNSTDGSNAGGGGISGKDVAVIDSTVSNNFTSGNNSSGGGINAEALTVVDSTISNNSTSGDESSGGGIYADVLTIVDSTTSGNSTAGEFAHGGGIYAQADVSLTGSTLSENFTSGARSAGGGLFTDDHVSLIDSRITGNATAGDNANGGAIYADDLTVTDSIVSGNSTAGSDASGGGLFAQGDAVIMNSPISENSTSGDSADGGGIYAAGNVILNESTISGNTTLGSLANGAGISAGGNVGLTNSTVSENSTVGYLAGGGGIHADGNVSLAGSEILGNSVDGDFAEGGGIWAFRNISLTRSTVSDNHTRGRLAHGGGIFALGGESLVIVIESVVSENSTEGFEASGGGIYGRNVSLNDSTASGNSTTGEDADGGGIYASDVVLTSSTISGNSATGNGGGVDVANISLTDSTVSGNSTQGEYSVGGGIYADGNVTLTGSTISGNSTLGEFANGGGIYSESGSVNIRSSTITGNSTSGIQAGGGGLFAYEGNVSIVSSIVAGNSAHANQMPDMRSTGSPTVSHSLIGDNPGAWLVEAQTPDADGNLIGSSAGGGIIDPMLGSLADNSGPTETHALLRGSPAIDSGSNPDGLEFDQRGEPFVRVFGGAPDMGAVELQPSHITGLFVNSSLWNEAFRENLGEFGFSLTGEPAGPLPLSWSHLDQISITVVGDASEMPPTGLRLFGAVHGTYALDAGRFQYDSDSRTATWVLDSALHPNGIEADSLSVVLDDFTFSFDILPGDGNRNGIVDIRDVQALRVAHLANIGDAGYQPELDFDGSGSLDLRDLQILRENLLIKLPKQLPSPVLASLPRTEDAQPLAVTRRNSRHDRVFATLTDDYVFDKSDLFGHE